MGLTHVTVAVSSTRSDAPPFESSFLVDTGATDSLVPADELEKAGVSPIGKMAFELANGEVVEYAFGIAKIEFMGEITAGRVILVRLALSPCSVLPRSSRSEF